MSTQPSFPSPLSNRKPSAQVSVDILAKRFTHKWRATRQHRTCQPNPPRCIPMSMPDDHTWSPKRPPASCSEPTPHVSTPNKKAKISTYGRNLRKIWIWQNLDKGQDFIPQARLAARIPLFTWKTRACPQIADPGTVRHGSEVEVIRVFGSRISENTKIGPW